MKKIVISMFCLFAITLGINADNDRITTDINELPQQSREFILKWFGDTAVSHIKIDRNLMGVEGYDVLLTNGIEIEFNKAGEWIEVDGNENALPEGILSEEIINQIQTLYPGQQIKKIELDGRNTEVKLRNRIELTFNRDGKLIEADR